LSESGKDADLRDSQVFRVLGTTRYRGRKGLQLTVNDEDQKKTCRQEATLVSTGQYLRGHRPGFHVQNSGSRVQGFGFWVKGLGLRIYDAGCRV
jgi:hypothetical protein